MAAVRGALFALLLLAGCGDALVPGDYGGEKKLLLRGKIDDATPALLLPTEVVRTGIFWNPRGVETPQALTELIEQPSNSRYTKYPGGFEWSLFDEPEPSQRFQMPNGGQYAFGVPLAYVDANSNRRWDPGEQFVADSPISAVLFVPAPLSAEDSPTGHSVDPGYYVILNDRPCSAPPQPPAEGDCGVPLGARCDVDRDCNGGECILGTLLPWPGGYCAIPEPPPNGCRPRQGALVSDPPTGKTWWMQACQHPSDCTRGFPYQCELTRGACLPSAHVTMVGSRDIQPKSFCQAPPPDGSGSPP